MVMEKRELELRRSWLESDLEHGLHYDFFNRTSISFAEVVETVF